MRNKSENQCGAHTADRCGGAHTICCKKGTDIRFIEMMPVGEGHTNGVEPYKKVIGTLSKLYGEPCRINTEKQKKLIREITNGKFRITARQSITFFRNLVSE